MSTEHKADNLFDASTSWVERPKSHNDSSVRLCTRELQNFDGCHSDMSFVSAANDYKKLHQKRPCCPKTKSRTLLSHFADSF